MTRDHSTVSRISNVSPITVVLTQHQMELLDEWIDERREPRPSRAEALALHFDWSIARCSSQIDTFPRSTVANTVTGKDMF